MGSCISGGGGRNVIYDFWYLGKHGDESDQDIKMFYFWLIYDQY